MKIRKFIKKIIPNCILFKYNLIKFRKQNENEIKKTELHYEDVVLKIKSKNNKILRVASYVVFDSSFGGYGFYELMFENPSKYFAKIVVIPDVCRGHEHLLEQYKLTKLFFEKKYGKQNVLDGYNEITGEFIDFSDQFDVIYLANPYDAMVNKVHGVGYLSTKNCLPIYISYGCMPDNYGCKKIMPMKEISLFWKVFADNKMSYEDYKKYELCHGKNVILSGYAKMDSLINFSRTESTKKRIIIAPHHTINNKELPLSNFLEYKDFFLELPGKYPQIQFIFRPHPLLFTNMVNEGFWNKKDVENYIDAVKKNGMIYSTGGDYFDIFVDSEAMIHDCSSFVVEYLYTGKPCCFMAKKNYKKIFSKLGKSCLKNYYLAFNEQQIMHFIDTVIINNEDTLKNKRAVYSKNVLALNYPNASEKILQEITSEIRRGEK